MSNKKIEMSQSRRELFSRFNNQPAPTTTDGILEETLGDRLLDLGISRRGFMQFCVGMAAMMGLPPTIRKAMADECMKLCQWPTELSHYRPLILSHFSREKLIIQL